jgi:hypothetical protein
MLRVSKVPPGDPSTEDYVGQNRFECLTCPYQFVINKRYYERKYMKKKEVEDILGGKGAWDNVDKTEGMDTMGWKIRRRRWLMREQCNVQMRSVVMTRRIGINCRSGVLMSL